MKPRYAPEVYAALQAAGMSNREIARHLDVTEISVRRGLKSAPTRTMVRREFRVIVEEV